MDIEAVRERFMRFVTPPNDRGCRVWTGSRSSSGYGTFSVGGGEVQGAHVVAWRLAHDGRRVPKGWVVRHRCDVPLCVTAAHLVSGTVSQNIKECFAKKRRKPPRALDLLTPDMVREGRRVYAEGRLNQRELAVLWGVTPPVVSNIMRRKSYVGGPYSST